MGSTTGTKAFVEGSFARKRAAVYAGGLAALMLLGISAAQAAVTPTITFTGPSTYTPGTSVSTYVLDVGNSGVDADTAAIAASFPSPATISWNCAVTAGGATCGANSGTTNVAHTSTFPANSSLRYTFTVVFPASMDTATFTATASSNPVTNGPGTVTDNVVSNLARSADIAMNKTVSVAAHLPLGGSVYTVTATNNGPSDARGPLNAPAVLITDPEPAGVDFDSWGCSRSSGGACTVPNPPAGSLSQTVDIPVGVTYTYTAVATYRATVPATVNNVATGAVQGSNITDPDGGNNSDGASTGRDPQADLSVAVSPSGAGLEYTPGTTGNLVIVTVSNANASTDQVVPLSLNLDDAAISQATWVCNPLTACSGTDRTGDITTNVSVARSSAVTLTLTVDYYSDSLVNPLTYEPVLDIDSRPGADAVPDPTDKRFTSTFAIKRRADISILKTASAANVSPGGSYTYDLVIRNNGPSDVGNVPAEPGILLTDTFVASLEGNPLECGASRDDPCWSLCPNDAGDVRDLTITSCPVGIALVNGNGNIAAQALRLRAGSSSTVKVYAAVSPSASGSIANTATVALGANTPAVEEIGTSNNTSTANISATATTDIVIEKTDNETLGTAGAQRIYTVTVRNDGFNIASNVGVADTLPIFSGSGAGFVPGSISWQCRAFDGGCCTHNGAANSCGTAASTPAVQADVLNAAIDLGARSRVEFTITGTTDPRSSGVLRNTATATAPAGLPDANPANNTASDDTTLETVAGLSIQKRLRSLEPNNANGFKMVYEIVVANAGPSRAAATTVSDPLVSPLDAAGATWTCTVVDNPGSTTCPSPASGTGALSRVVALDAGGRVRFDIEVPTVSAPSNPISNTATAQQGANIVSMTVVSSLRGEGDLSIQKTDFISAPNRVVPGKPNDYLVTVRNAGSDDVFGARIADVLPPEFESSAWTCAATTPVPGDLKFLMQEGGSNGGRAIVASPDGRQVYVASSTGKSVSAYDRVAVPGLGFGNVALLETESDGVNDAQDIGTVVTGLQNPIDIAISPDGAMLFVLSRKLDTLGSSIASFNRVATPSDPAFGKLTFAGSTSVTGDAPVEIEASLTHVYVSGVASGVSNIAVYRRSASNGLPAFDLAYTDGVPANAGPLAISLSESRLFAAAASGTGIASFRISDGTGPVQAGRLEAKSLLADAQFGGMTDLVVVANGKHLYAMATGTQRVGVLSYNNDTLIKLTSYTASALSLDAAAGAAFSQSARLAVSPDGEHVLIAQGALSAGPRPELVQLRRDRSSGSLLREAELFGGLAPGIAQASHIAFAPDGRHVFVTSTTAAKQLSVYSRRAPDPVFGFLEADREAGAVTGLDAPADVAISGDGRHVYSVSLGDGALVAFRRDARNAGNDANGAHLVHLATYVDGANNITGLARASRVMISPDRRSVFVSSEDNNTVAVFSRNDDSASVNFGRLTFQEVLRDGVNGVDGLLGAQGIALDASGSNLYVAGSFEAAVATFSRNTTTGALAYLGVIKGGAGGAVGMGGMRDLVVAPDGKHVFGVATLSNAVVVLVRDGTVGSANFGKLRFLQARTTTGVRLMSIALPSIALNPADNEHVYVVGQDDDSLIVLKRVVDPASTAYGTLSTLHEYRGISGLDGPRDLALSPDGRRVFVVSQYDNSVVVFDRDLNRSSVGYGGLQRLEVSRDEADGVDGIDSPYALAVSNDGRNVYVAGFDDRAIASFGVGAGSYCSAAGSGDIDDVVNIGAGGTVEYRLRVLVRPDATGQLCNTATVTPPANFTDPSPGNNTSQDCSPLVPEAAVSIAKTNGQLSAVAGQTVRYTVRVDNPGPSSLVHSGASPFTVSDLLDSNPGFVSGSASWTCLASDSGALDFVQSRFDGEPNLSELGGISDLALVADPDGALPLTTMLAAASVLDDSLTLFVRDPSDGQLTAGATAKQGVGGITTLAGARAVAASSDGRHLYVASRASDSVTVFGIGGASQPTLTVIDSETGVPGLDQATHVVLSADGKFLYVAGANDDGIAVFARGADGRLTWIESEQNGIDDASDGAPAPSGLDGVDYLVISPVDTRHLYALSSSSGTIVRFERDVVTGRLAWRDVRDGTSLAVDLSGLSAATFDSTGAYLYVAASNANRLVVLGRVTSPAAGNFGDLRLLSSVSQGVGSTLGLVSPRRVVLSQDNAHLYVTAQGGSSIAWFGRDPFDGSLRFLGLRSADSGGVDGMQGATGLAIDPVLDQVYVAGTLQSAVVQFARQSDSSCPPSGTGQLNAVPISVGAGGSVVFTIDVDVASTLSGSLVNTATVSSAYDTDPANNTATDSDEPARVADLRITKDDGLAAYDGLAGARTVVGDTRHLYVAGSADNAIGHFTRDDVAASPTFGALHFDSVARTGSGGVLGLGAVSDLALSSDGAHLYAVSPTENSIAAFKRGADGKLSYIEAHRNGVLGVAGMSGARAMAMTTDRRHVYVVSEFSNALVTFARDDTAASANYGKLAYAGVLQHAVAGVDGLQQPLAVAVSPDGAHVYVLSNGGSTLAVFRRNPNSGSASFGQLTYVTRYTGAAGASSGLEGARSMAFDAAGTNLYVLGSAPGTLAQFVRTAASGELALGVRLVQGGSGGTGLAGAQRVRLTPDGTQLVVAGAGDASVSHFTLTAGVPAFAGRIANGDAVLAGGLVSGLAGASDVFVPIGGTQLYSTGATDAALAGFDRVVGGALAHRETFFDGLGGVAPGEFVRYRIEVSNLGPAAVPDARVVDTFPAQFVSASWTCGNQVGGAQCDASGSGNLNEQVNLPAGSSLVFVATGVLGTTASGTLVNTATVTGIGVSDPAIANNSATDGNTVLSPALDLVASIPSTAGTQVPGGAIEYRVRIDNLGPTYATGARITDVLPPALRDVSWTCQAFPVPGLLAPVQALAGDNLKPASVTLTPPGAQVANVTSVTPSALGQQVYATATLTDGSEVVLVLARDPLDGRLAPLQLLRNGVGGVNALSGAAYVVLSGDERFAYVAAAESDAIVVFARDSGTGQLTFVTRYQDGELGVDGIGGVRHLVIAPGGGHLYAAGTLDDAIAVFAINPGNGLLSQTSVVRQSQAGMDGLNGVTTIALSGNNAHVIAIAGENQSIAAFARNPANGVLTRVALRQEFELATGALATPATLEVSGKRVLVGSGNGLVAEFAFDPAATPLAFVAQGAPFNVGGSVGDLVFEPDQARLYVATATTLRLYSLLGATPELLGSYATPQPRALARSPDGRQLYSAGAELTTWSRERGSHCPLEGLGGIGEQSANIAPGGRIEFTLGGSIFANATGNLEYEVEVQSRDLGAERVPANNVARNVLALRPRPLLGASKTDGRTETVAGLATQYTIGVANTGISAAVGARVSDPAPMFPASNAGLLAGSGAWSCSVDAAIASLESRSAVAEPMLQGLGEIVVSADGKRAYAVNPLRNALLAFARLPDGSLGALREIRNGDVLGAVTVSGLDGASSIAISRDGRTLLVTGAASNTLVVLSHDAAANTYAFVQKLTSNVDNVVGLLGPEDVKFSADERFVYVASPASDAIAQFSRDPASGLLTFVQRVRDGFGTIAPDSEVIRRVHRLWPSDDGKHLYALSRGQNGANAEAVSSFAIGPGTGILTYLGVTRRSAVAGLAGLRDVAAAPGDPQLYVLGDGAIVRFDRQADGRLQFASALTGAPGLVQPRALAMDAPGARLYLVDGGGRVATYARDWSSGELAFRQRSAGVDPAPVGGAHAVHGAAHGELLVAVAEGGQLVRYDERPLSHCQLPAATNDAIDTLVDLDLGGRAALVYTARVHPSARGTLVNTATLAARAGSDPAALPGTAQDSTLIRAVSDLSVDKTAPERAVAGTDVSWQIRVSNAGPSDALGIRVVDMLDAVVSAARWTCTATAGSSCPASGNGAFDIPATLEVGDELIVTVTARIRADFVGTLPNSVSVVPEIGSTDPTPTDNSDSTTTRVEAEADLSVSKDDGLASVMAGMNTTYRIVVTNHGPSDSLAIVRDPTPAGIQSMSVTCTASGGAVCPEASTGVNFDRMLPAGGSLTFDAFAIIEGDARGELVNEITVGVPATVVSRIASNNLARDVDTIEARADLAVALVDPLDPFDPNGPAPLPFEVQIDNFGPSSARFATLSVDFGRSVSVVPPENCTFDGRVLKCELGTIDSGASVRRLIGATGLPAAPAVMTVTATVASDDPDPTASNNTDTTTTALASGGDIDVRLVRTTATNAGQRVGYEVDVRNLGSTTMTGFDFDLAVSSELIAVSWTCTAAGGATCTPAGTGSVDTTLTLARGASVKYLLSGTLDSSLNQALPNYVRADAIATTAPGADINPDNNAASDRALVMWGIFRDGFETLVANKTILENGQ